MNTATWAEIKRVFGQALEVAEEHRAGWLETHCGDAEIRREVMSLLAEYRESAGFLEHTPDEHARVLEQALSEPLAGQRLGPYRLVREIGRGGMGLVFEALREGEDFEKRFALKVIRAGMNLDALAARFRRERRILSRLEHPGIVALLDGGATASGLPYLVMEYVEGAPIGEWARQQQLGPREIVELALRVCECVSYAHRHLVVHCDLKPNNILITPGGHPKLLDFGIARALAEDSHLGGEDATRTGLFLFTPEFASPEQLQGRAVTTASDVYSIGVLLYGLLAEARPFKLTGLAPLEAMHLVLETEPVPPSQAAPPRLQASLKGDLDNIVMRCLRKDAVERYATVDALAADLKAWLAGKPVSATRPTFGYRVRRWFSRNKPYAAALAALALSLAAGAAATAWQAYEAHQARLRAEARSLAIQKMARSLLFEIHESISRVPGTTPARELLLRRATEFLDGAANEAGDDHQLGLELAEGYRRLGSVMGSSLSDNLGLKQDALSAFRKGRDLAEQAVARRPGEFEPLDVLARILVQQGLLFVDQGQPAGVEDAASRLQGLVDLMARRFAGNPEARASVAINLSQLAMMRTQQKSYEDAQALYGRAIEAFAALPPEQARLAGVRTQRAFANKRLGALLIRAGQLEPAEARYREALAVEQDVISEDPGNPALRYDLSFTYSDLGLIALRKKQFQAAAESYSRAAAIRDEFAAADPKNVRALQGAAYAHCQLAFVLGEQLRFATALDHAARCLELRSRVDHADGSARQCAATASANLLHASLYARQAEHAAGAGRAASVGKSREWLERGRAAAGKCAGSRDSLDEEVNRLQARLQDLSRAR